MNNEEFIAHHGVGHLDGGNSGRYPWGSGEDPYQSEKDFLTKIDILKKRGWTETPENIEKEFGMKSTEYRRKKSICNNAIRMQNVARAKQLRASGHGASDIGRRLGVRESTVRGWFNEEAEARMYQSKNTADMLKKKIDSLPRDKQMIDVGVNVERELNISREKLDTALTMLKEQGYNVYSGRVPQPTNKNQSTTLKVLAGPDVKHKEIYKYENIQTVNDYISNDGGDTFEKRFTYPASMDSKRMMVRYANDVDSDGVKGIEKDGIVEIRRGVPDLSLGNSRYAQVRILVDKTHYIKGMAVYSDDMPDGIDVVFNTNKTREKYPNKKDVLKEIKNDPDNPFGSAIKDVELGGQYWYTDKNGKKKLGLINKRADEGDWTEWKDTLPSQFLSKQSRNMAEKQLNLAKAEKQAEFDTIMSLNNPTIKRYYLEKFASSCDGAAVELKAAALPGQKYHVIIPINSMGEDKIYAPKYKDGTKLALVRYPHGGIFEIPILTVDNKNPKARKILPPDSDDAVGISAKVAERLSGADFDGDTVMCIPTHDRAGRIKISSQPELKGLKGFDPKLEYGTEMKIDSKGEKHYYRAGHEINVMKNTNLEMGVISNLISDMTLQGAPDDEKARAVRHSMVVIDAEKHKLDYQQSYRDNNIAELKRKWQKKIDKDGNITYGGASTIISKAKGPVKVLKRKGEPRVNIKGSKYYDPSKPEGSLIYVTAPDNELYYADSKYNKTTGKKTIRTVDNKLVVYDMNNTKDREKYEPVMRKDKKTGEVYFTNRDGNIKYKTKVRTMDSTKMAETTDAMSLVSPIRHPMELLYADYANHMKALANQARIEKIKTGKLKYNPNAAKIYAKEVSELNVKLDNAMKNSIKERTATRLATAAINKKKEANPDLKGEDLRKVSQREMVKQRQIVGAIPRRERSINITDREWEAIQAGAISDKKLTDILNNSDPDILRERAMPKSGKSLNSAQITRIKAMRASNFTIVQIAEKMNVSPSLISKYLKGDK